MPHEHVSAIIPSYNGQHLLAKHLPSVFKALRAGDQVVIVDDASIDQSIEWLTDQFHLKLLRPRLQARQARSVEVTDGHVWQGHVQLAQKRLEVTVLQNQKNLRFAESCNRGAALATGRFFFLLNNDVEPHRDVLEHLLPYFKDQNTFAVGCREGNSGRNELWFERGLFQHRRAPNQKSGPTAWVSGGSGLFDAEKWRTLGGFDPQFAPAYWEDIDLSERARRRGWHVLFEEKAVVEHHHETTNQDVFGHRRIQQMSWRNAHRFAGKHGTFTQKMTHLLWLPYWWWQQWRQA